jgi:Protoglobin
MPQGLSAGGDGVIDTLLRFLEFDDDTRQLGKVLWEILEPGADNVLDAFYRRVQLAGLEPSLSDASIARLKVKQRAHWQSLFCADFDNDYIASVRRIGIRHREVGLDLASYVAAYMALKIEFTDVVVARPELPVRAKGRLIKTLYKYVALDMALALSTYDVTLVD